MDSGFRMSTSRGSIPNTSWTPDSESIRLWLLVRERLATGRAEAVEKLLELLLQVAMRRRLRPDPTHPGPEAELRHLLLDLGCEGHLGSPARRLQRRRSARAGGLPGERPLRVLRLDLHVADGLGEAVSLELGPEFRGRLHQGPRHLHAWHWRGFRRGRGDSFSRAGTPAARAGPAATTLPRGPKGARRRSRP